MFANLILVFMSDEDFILWTPHQKVYWPDKTTHYVIIDYCTISTECSVMGHKWLWIEHLRCFIMSHRLLWTLHWVDFCIIWADLTQFSSKMNNFGTSHSQILPVNLVSNSQVSHVTPREHSVKMVQYFQKIIPQSRHTCPQTCLFGRNSGSHMASGNSIHGGRKWILNVHISISYPFTYL